MKLFTTKGGNINTKRQLYYVMAKTLVQWTDGKLNKTMKCK